MNDTRLRIVVADSDSDAREFLTKILTRLGHQVVGAADSGRKLVEQVLTSRPDLVLTDVALAEMDGFEAAAVIGREAPTPVVLTSAADEIECARCASGAACVMAWLIKPVGEPHLKTSILLALARFGQIQSLATEAAGLRQTLEERKVIERAKGVVMQRLDLNEQDAFRRLRMFASSQNRKLVDVCRQVVASEEVFHRIESFDAPSE